MYPEWMRRNQLFRVLMLSALGCCLATGAQEIGAWRAESKNAQSITGDVAFSETRMAMNYSSFSIARIRDLEPGEVSAVFDADSNAGARGALYRLNIPAGKTFNHKNTLCGSEDTQWMAAYVAERSLHLAFFSSQKMPVFTPEAISNSTDLCGTFNYVR